MVEREVTTGFPERNVRRGAAEVLSRSLIPLEVNYNPETTNRLHELMSQDYGIIELTNHWGLMEIPALIEFNFLNEDLRKSNTLFPYASHQYDRFNPALKLLGREALDLDFVPTATPNSDKYYEENNLAKPDGYDEFNERFINEAENMLFHGGVVILAPQGQRECVYPAKTFQKGALSPFLLGLEKQKRDRGFGLGMPEGLGIDFKKIAFLFIATGLKDTTDYEGWQDTKWTQPHPPVVVNVGGIYTFEESGLEGNLLRANKWAHGKLLETLPQEFPLEKVA